MAFLLTPARSALGKHRPCSVLCRVIFRNYCIVGVSVLGDSQSLSGHSPGQRAQALSLVVRATVEVPQESQGWGVLPRPSLGSGFQRTAWAPMFLQSFLAPHRAIWSSRCLRRCRLLLLKLPRRLAYAQPAFPVLLHNFTEACSEVN